MKNKIIVAVMAITGLALITGCSKEEEDHNIPESTEVVVVLNNLSETYSYYLPETHDTVIDVDTTGSVPNDILIDGNYAFIVNSGFGGKPTVMKIDLLKDSVMAYVVLPDGSNPWAVIKSQDNLFVSCSGNDRVYKLDLYTLRILDSVKVGKAPEGMADKDGRIYVACTGYNFSDYTYNDGFVYVIEEGPSGLFVSDSIYAGLNTQDVVVVGDTLYALATGDYSNVQGKIYAYEIGDSLSFLDTIKVGNNPGYLYYYNGALYLTDWFSGVCRVSLSDKEIVWMQTGTGTSRLIVDMNGTGFITRFSSNDANYLLVFDPERVQVYDSVFMGNSKGIQGLGIWIKIH